MKAYRGSGVIVPRIHLRTRWSYLLSLTSRPLYLRGKSSQYPLRRRLSVFQSRSGRAGKEKKSHHCPRRELNPGRLAGSLISTLTELSLLLSDP